MSHDSFGCGTIMASTTKSEDVFAACESGDLSRLNYLITKNPSSARGKRGYSEETPLHVACRFGRLGAVKYLIETAECDPQCVDKYGETPLHKACRYGCGDVADYLIRHMDPKWTDNDGLTLLHVACLWDQLETVKYLIEVTKCDPQCVDHRDWTPLHVACGCDQLETVKYLIEVTKYDPQCVDHRGWTPLHVACGYHQLETVKYLIEVTKCDPQCVDHGGKTPLHIACGYDRLQTVKYLIEKAKCDPQCVDHDGKTPLHIACRYDELQTVKYLIEKAKCDPQCVDHDGKTPLHIACRNIDRYSASAEDVADYLMRHMDPKWTDNDGSTLLHIACRYNRLEAVKYLIELAKCDPQCVDHDGKTPLHVACRYDRLEAVKYLIELAKCDPQCVDHDGKTPLHVACGYDRLEAVKYLIELAKCDPQCVDHDGKTPLHVACGYRRTGVVPYLLKEVQLNPDCTTKSGKTPLSLTNEPAIIRELLRYGATPDYQLWSKHLPSNCPEQPAPQVVKAFVVGDPGAGKSTLTKSLQTETESNVLSYIANRMLKVSGVDQKTAGIVPHDIESRRFGPLTLYDFAGHKEFYAGHDAVLRSAVSGSPAAIFLIVADLYSSDEEFKERIQYWLAFLENQGLSADHKPHVIVVCSHADQLKKAAVDEKRSIVDSLQKSPAFSSFHFAGFVAMDCRYSESTSMSLLRQYLAKSCEQLRSRVEMSCRSHCFLVYLLDRFRGCPAIELSKIASTLGSESANKELAAFIPEDVSGISHICDELNERGNILFLKGSEVSQNSWIILDREALLSRVTGTVFAPKDFKQYKNLASSTGVVPFSKVATHISDLDPDMIVHFLCHLEFCHKIADSEILQLLRSSENSKSVATFDPTEKFFFFPNLVSIEVPSGVWESSQDFDYHCGWVLQCEPGQFFTPRFLQVLLLRLAFYYALAPDVQQAISGDLPTLKRKCKVWKSGIYWGNRSGVEALVELGEGSRRVVFMLRCSKGRQVECAHLRSAIIGKLLQVRSEFCPKVAICEFLLRPSDSKDYPPKLSAELTLITTSELAKAVMKAEPGVLDMAGNGISIADLLVFEPYAYLGERIIHELFDEQNPSYSEQLSDDFLYSIADKNYHMFDLIQKMLNLSAASVEVHISQALPGEAHKMAHLLLCWRERSEGSRQCFHQTLDQFSVFAGRNPIELARTL